MDKETILARANGDERIHLILPIMARGINEEKSIVEIGIEILNSLPDDKEIAKRLWEEWFAECVDTVNISNYNIHFNMKNSTGRMFPDWLYNKED